MIGLKIFYVVAAFAIGWLIGDLITYFIKK